MAKPIQSMLVVFWALVFSTPVMAQQAPQWEDARKAILEDYKRHQPDDKVLEVARAQQSELRFLMVRHFARVTVERADRTRSRDHMAVEYRLVGDKWEVANVRLIGSEALPGIGPPSSKQK